MSAIVYLMLHSVKNWFKRLKEKPAVAIATVFIIVFITLSLVSSVLLPTPIKNQGNIDILYLIFFVLSLLFIGTAIYGGLSTGTSLFAMSDVNLMFTSPLSSTLVLIYGVIRQMGKSMFLAVFMLFQVSNLKSNFGISAQESLFIVIVYMALVFITPILTLGIYAFTNGNQLRKTLVKYISIMFSIAAVVYIAHGFYSKGISVIRDIALSLFPIAGWLTAIIINFLNGNILVTLAFVLITLVFIVFIIFAIIKWQPDYYEDCLINSENTFHAKQFAKGDKSARFNMRKKKISKNISSIAFKGGSGASAIMYRHLVEIKRTNRFLGLGFSSILYLILGIACGFIVEDGATGGLYLLLSMVLYLNMFLVGITRLSQELSRQFIYLIPDSPFKKLLYASASSIYLPVINGVLLILPAVIIAQLPILNGLALILAFSSINCLFVSGNTLMYAIFGKFSNSFIVMIVYYFSVTTLLIPAAVVGIIFGLIFSSVSLSLAIGSIMNYGVFLLVLFICRNMVNNIDFK